MGLLRERMAGDLKLRGLAPITVASYLRYAQRFAEHYAPRSPVRLGEREVKDFLLHMIEETARHNGHADLLRESIDGLTGE